MGKIHDKIDEQLADFLQRQHLFFVATAPRGSQGHINLSPKGLDSFRVLDSQTVAYVDFIGSGVETLAHLKENGRIVLMFCALDGPPKIVRLHGRGEVIEAADPRFDSQCKVFPAIESARAVIRVCCTRISDSCGFGVPRFEFRGQRTQLVDWARSKSEDKLLDFQRKHNGCSIDGLAGMSAHAVDGDEAG